MSKDLMFDIEALGIAETAVILSIGWCWFDWDNPRELVLEGGYFTLDRQDQITRGRTIDASTAKWWAEQENEAILAAFRGHTDQTHPSIGKFISSLNTADRIWANGVDYDCRLTKDWLAGVAPEVKWPFRKQCDMRTLKALFGTPDITEFAEQEMEKKFGVGNTVAHNALHDALYQANYLRSLRRYMLSNDIRYQGLEAP